MKQYQAFFGEATIHVMARTEHEAQSKASAEFKLPGRLQHMVKVRLAQGDTA